MPATLSDIAKYSGVSVATASLALNNKPVNDKTKQKVLHAAQRLGYQPSAMARGLRTRKTQTLGLTLCHTNLELMESIVKTAQLQNYHIITQTFEYNNPKNEQAAYETLLSGRVDGVIMWPSETGLDYARITEQFRQRNIPLVFVDRHLAGIHVPAFAFDNKRGSKMAWMHLKSLGYDPIVYLDFDVDFSSILDRREGVKDAHLATGTRWNDELNMKAIKYECLDQQVIHQALKTASNGGAILAAADHIAFAVLRQAWNAKIKIPQDMAVIGFEDTQIWLNERIGWTTCPPLSNIRMRFNEVGRQATEHLIDMIKNEKSSGEGPSEVQYIDPLLIVRESCGGKAGIYGLNEKDEMVFIEDEEY